MCVCNCVCLCVSLCVWTGKRLSGSTLAIAHNGGLYSVGIVGVKFTVLGLV